METYDLLLRPFFEHLFVLEDLFSKLKFIPSCDSGFDIELGAVAILPLPVELENSLPEAGSRLPVKRVHSSVGFVVPEESSQGHYKLISVKIIKIEPSKIFHHRRAVSIPVPSQGESSGGV